MQANLMDLERLMKEVTEFRVNCAMADEESTRKYTRQRIFLLTTIEPRSFENFYFSLSLLFSTEEIFFYRSTKKYDTS